ncbi:hypothetical protein JCM8547_004812 [Rhodosporidiobolus lusitaniae]
MQTNLPSNYRAAAFEKPGAPISIRQVEMKQPRENENLVKTVFASLSSTDEVLRNDLAPSLHYPIGIKLANGVVEYARVHTECAIEIKKGELQGREHEAPVLAYDAGRVLGSYRRCQRDWHAIDENERHMIREINERIGFGKHEGVIVVYGEGGFARLAIDVLEKCEKERQSSSGGGVMSMLFGSSGNQKMRVMLVTTSNRWTPSDYQLSDRDVLHVDKDNVGDKLKQTGGANLVVCVDQPRQKFEQLLDGFRYNADVSILSPSKNGEMQLPLGNILAKALRTCRLVEKHNIRAPAKQHRFDQNEPNQAWREMEHRSTFDAPVVVFQQGQQ